jgi:hypothetical protein
VLTSGLVQSCAANSRSRDHPVGAPQKRLDDPRRRAGIPGGFKGAGEAGTAGAPAAILNAVNDALSPLDAIVTEQPLTAERVWRAIQNGGPGLG